MKKIPFNKNVNVLIDNTISTTTTTTTIKFLMPLQIKWQPKEDITVHEIALCMPYLLSNRPIMPYDVDLTETYFRHFEIIDPNI